MTSGKDEDQQSGVKVLSIKFSIKDFILMKDVAKKRGEDMSSFIRRSIKLELARLGFLSNEERKALGLPTIQ